MGGSVQIESNFMKQVILAFAAIVSLLADSAVAGDFSGLYVGGGLGVNRSSTSGVPATSAANAPVYGLEGGYAWDLGSALLGVEGFVDANQQAAHSSAVQYGSNTYGLGLKLGVPLDNLMPYARLGYDYTRGTGDLSGFSAGGANSGLGLMYKLTPNWSVEGEWSLSNPSTSGLKLKANNFNFGLNYHFDTPGPSTAGKNKSR